MLLWGYIPHGETAWRIPKMGRLYRKISDLTNDELRDWIDGCKAMESSAN